MSNIEGTKSNSESRNAVSGKSGPVMDKNKDKSRREGEKKGAINASLIGVAVVVIITVLFYSMNKRDHDRQAKEMTAQKIAMSGQIASRDSIISEWITTFDEIEKNISLIKEKEKLIAVNSKDAELSRNKKEMILADIKAINTLLDQNKKKIATLTAQLAQSGGTIKALQAKVADLELSVKKSENEIVDLKNELVGKNFEIKQLNTRMAEMEDTLVQKNSLISNQINALNKAFYVCGTFKELKAKGLLTKEGGFIGFGKTETLVSNFSDTTFTQVDLSQLKSIPVNSKKARLITDHPSGSFQFTRDGEKKVISLDIKDPGKFWKISKYAVVELTK